MANEERKRIKNRDGQIIHQAFWNKVAKMLTRQLANCIKIQVKHADYITNCMLTFHAIHSVIWHIIQKPSDFQLNLLHIRVVDTIILMHLIDANMIWHFQFRHFLLNDVIL